MFELALSFLATLDQLLLPCFLEDGEDKFWVGETLNTLEDIRGNGAITLMTVLRCEFELLRRYEARTQVIGNALAFLSHFVSLKGGQTQRGIYEFTINRLAVSFDLEKYKENLGKSLLVCNRTYLVHAFGKYMASSLRNMYIGMQKRIKTTKQEEQKENRKQKIMKSRNSLSLSGCILDLIRELFKDDE